VGSALVKHLADVATKSRGQVIAGIEAHCRDLAAAVS
jgi:hypothetical protein